MENNTEFEELKKLFPTGQLLKEGGNSFFYLPELVLPEDLTPNPVAALFCPNANSLDGYASLLYLSSIIQGGPSRNWNKTRVILGRTWYAFSWQFQTQMRLAELLRSHISSIYKS